MATPYAPYIGNSWIVLFKKDGLVTEKHSIGGSYVRPACNFNLNNIILTSAAEGGKSKDGMSNGLTAIDSYTGNEWKATFLDYSRSNFTASKVELSGSRVTISYAGAITGTNEYISAMLWDEVSGSFTYYGRVKNITEISKVSGILDIDLANIDTTDKALFVFNEQYNGGDNDDTKLTDYASALQEIPLYDLGGPYSEVPDAPEDFKDTENMQDDKEDANKKATETGDDSNLIPFVILAVISAIGGTSVVVFRRRIRH